LSPRHLPQTPVVELRLMPAEWRAVLFGLGSFLIDLQEATAELEEADAIASPALTTVFTAFRVTLRTTISLRKAIDLALERNQSAQKLSRRKGQSSGRVAVRHAALSALPSILDDATQRLTETGHIPHAQAMKAVFQKVNQALSISDLQPRAEADC
jgi:hypothetical protein